MKSQRHEVSDRIKTPADCTSEQIRRARLATADHAAKNGWPIHELADVLDALGLHHQEVS